MYMYIHFTSHSVLILAVEEYYCLKLGHGWNRTVMMKASLSYVGTSYLSIAHRCFQSDQVGRQYWQYRLSGWLKAV